MSVIDIVRRNSERLIELRHDLHAHPELGFSEYRTADVIARELERLGADQVHTGIGKTGVVGVIHGRSGSRGIGLRADMDALPLQERNTFAHTSRYPGRMHACGHDGHVVMLLAAAEVLAQQRDFDGTVYLIFQPAEEGEGGARQMIEDGLFGRFPMMAIFGMHNWPGLPAGHFAVHSGAVMAGTDRFEIEVTGRGAHAAMPHLGADPIVAGAALVQAIQTITSRTLDPLESAVVSTTIFQAGDADNIIPDRALLGGTVRYFNEAVRSTVQRRLSMLCSGVASTFGVRMNLEYARNYPATINSASEAALCADVAAAVVGEDNVSTELPPSMGAEDFAYYLQQKPGCYVWLGNGPSEGGCNLHNPKYDFNDDLIPIGAAYWVTLTQMLLSPSD